MHNPYCMRCAATHAATPAIAFAQFRFSWGELCCTYYYNNISSISRKNHWPDC